MTAAALKKRALILNADGRPLSTWPLSLISAQDAVHGFFRDRLVILENWPDEFFHSPSTTIAVPKAAMLRHYAKVTGSPKFCRRSIILRDLGECQYCGQQFPSHDLTFDHVIPRAAGGTTCWENIVSACIGCNAEKADRHLRPLRAPRRPTHVELLAAGLRFLPNDLREDFGSYLYWSVRLDP